MKLYELIEGFPIDLDPSQKEEILQNCEISGLSSDTRTLGTNNLFIALNGQTTQGTSFIPQAIKAGACAVLLDRNASVPSSSNTDAVVYLRTESPQLSLAHLTQRFYPNAPKEIALVTGTNGKTSVADFIRQLSNLEGTEAASIGTLGLCVSSTFSEVPLSLPPLTSPDFLSLHKALDWLASHNVQTTAIEASSHGLDQGRLDTIPFSVAAFTNLTRDHLDYHKTFKNYQDAKARLFTELLPVEGHAVINADDPVGKEMIKTCQSRGVSVLSYGKKGTSLRLIQQKPLPNGQALELEILGEKVTITLPLIGLFQAYNFLAALGVLLSWGRDLKTLLPFISSLEGIPGRLETVIEGQNGRQAVVDYAHTPDALRTLLLAVRPHIKGRLILVFGCGGDRDKGKRSLMGEIAADLANLTLVTDDNPRSEDPSQIRQEVLVGCPHALEVSDRKEAVRQGLDLLHPHDCLVVAGKGHEQGQIVGDTILPFDDREVIKGLWTETPWFKEG